MNEGAQMVRADDILWRTESRLVDYGRDVKAFSLTKRDLANINPPNDLVAALVLVKTKTGRRLEITVEWTTNETE